MKNADIAKRFVAYIIDSLALGIILNILFVPLWCLLMVPLSLTERRPALATAVYRSSSNEMLIFLMFMCVIVLIIFLALVISYFYRVWFPVKKWKGATIGKRVMNIRIVRADGSEANQIDMFVREFIGKPISSLVFYLGYLWILFDDKGQGWHDKIADTYVIEAEERV